MTSTGAFRPGHVLPNLPRNNKQVVFTKTMCNYEMYVNILPCYFGKLEKPGKQEIVWKHDVQSSMCPKGIDAKAKGSSVSTQYRIFPISTSVDVTYINTEKCFIFFHNSVLHRLN